MNDAVHVIRLAGGRANAMDAALLVALEQHIDDFEAAPAAAAVLTGYDRFFSAGLALPSLIDLDRPALGAFMERFSDVMLRIFACEKPIIAAINGHAIAGGTVLALMCDRRICVDDGAKLGLTETQLGIGLPALVVEAARAQLPPASLVPIALEGRLLAPREAHELGLVHELAPAAELDARALDAAGALATQPAHAVAQVKRALRAPVVEAIARTRAAEAERWLDTWFHPEAQRRLRATVDKLRR